MYVRFALAALVALLTLCSPAFADDVSLPNPSRSGGEGIFSLLEHRASATGSNFPSGAIGDEELGTLLWAATGLNRGGEEKGWTVPFAMGREPYCKVYVAGSGGVFLYDWRGHALREVSKKDVRSSIGKQAFVTKAPYVLVFVIDGQAVAALGGGRGRDWGYTAVGAMTQDVYLAGASLGIGVRYVASLQPDVAVTALKLGEGDVPVCIMPIGKY
ncbi:MAG: nitroreductase family protein [Synergistaceae bacterium]|jgi:hypothetical protein|nr:nitroreductase family protein [Synergistaceae bacterium]